MSIGLRLALPLGMLRGRGAGAAAVDYAQILIDTYGFTEVWPLTDISSGTTIHAHVNGDRDGTLQGWDLQNTALLDTGESAPLSGTGDYGNIDTANLVSAFDGNEGAMFILAKASGAGMWTDGVGRLLLRLSIDNDNVIQILKAGLDNIVRVDYEISGVKNRTDITAPPTTEWFMFGVSWSDTNNEVLPFWRAETGGQYYGPVANGQIWSGDIVDALIGASSTTPANEWDGAMAYAAVKFGAPATPNDFDAIWDLFFPSVTQNSLDDDFSDGYINAHRYDHYIVGDGVFVESGGTLQADAPLTHAELYTHDKYLLSGDFDVQIDFSGWSQTGDAYLRLSDPFIRGTNKPQEEVRAFLRHDAGSGGGPAYGGEIRTGGEPSLLDGTGTYVDTTDTAGKLRVTRTGTTANTYYWDGSQWQSMKSGTIGTDDVGIGMWVHGNAIITFDNLVVNAGTVVAA